MNSNRIYAIIEQIAQTGSKLGKEALVREHGADEDFKRALVAALNPFVTYGIAKVPEASVGSAEFSSITWRLLDDLASRSLSGNRAREVLQTHLAGLTSESAELLKRIVTKDLRAGFSESTVNKALPGLVPTFDCMLAHPFDAKRVKAWPVIVEPKFDGVRVLAFVDVPGEQVCFLSRNGKEFTVFDHLKQPIIDLLRDRAFRLEGWLNTCVLDGEVVSGTFNNTVSEVRKKSKQAKDATFAVFDMVPRECLTLRSKEASKRAGSYADRRALMSAIFPHFERGAKTTEHRVAMLPAIYCHDAAEVEAVYAEFLAARLEGAIAKDMDGLYECKRSYAWMKLKPEETIDVPIVGAFQGTGKYANTLGGLIVDVNGVQVRVSGMTDEQRDQMWAAYQRDSDPGGTRYDGWVGELLGRLIEVEYHEVTPDGSLRHPRFMRFRDDKQIATV
jgi:DNA ligase-1